MATGNGQDHDVSARTALCAPAAANKLTGRTSSQNGVHDYLADGKSFETDRRAGQPTLVDLLAVAGDRTRLVGTCHLGRDAEPQHGFQDWFALAVDHPIDRPGPARRSCGGRLGRHEGRKADIITDAAVDFISRAEDRPFLLFVDRVTAHGGWAGHPEPRVDVYRGCTLDDVPQDEDRPFGIRTARAVTSSTA